MIPISEFRKGLHIKVEGEVYTIIEMQHHKPGKGGAMMRTKLKSVMTGRVFEKTFHGGDKVEEAELENRKSQYVYRNGAEYCFMDMETYEQVSFSAEDIGEGAGFLKENTEVTFLLYEGKVIGIEIPRTVELKVTYTEPGRRGDTVTNVLKPAIVETGREIQVPLFINTGDTIIVDTQTGKYVERK